MKPDSILIASLIGFGADLLFGDPENPVHPIRLIGTWISLAEKRIRAVLPKTAAGEFAGGILEVAAVLVPACGIPFLLILLTGRADFRLAVALESLWSWQLLACRQLKKESMRVYDALKRKSLPDARYAISRIVGRDTDSLDETEIAKAAVETVAENTSDGVIAPLVYLLLGGVPLCFLYKAVNTMDSMIGYRNDRYRYFGTAAARLDDVLNFIPARISGLLMAAASVGKDFSGRGAFRCFRRDRKKHASPNSACTEAVMAGALGVTLGGDARYFGKIVHKPELGDDLRQIETEDIARANRLMLRTSVAAFMLFWCIRLGVYLL